MPRSPYVDTSALVKRYVGEVGTICAPLLARPVRQAIYTALLAQTEVLSAATQGAGRDARSGRGAASGPARAAALCAPLPAGGDHASARDPGQCPRAGASLAGV